MNTTTMDIMWTTTENTGNVWSGVCLDIPRAYQNATILFIYEAGSAAVDDMVVQRDDKCNSFLVRRDESPENYCHSPGVVGGGGGVGVVRRQKPEPWL